MKTTAVHLITEEGREYILGLHEFPSEPLILSRISKFGSSTLVIKRFSDTKNLVVIARTICFACEWDPSEETTVDYLKMVKDLIES